MTLCQALQETSRQHPGGAFAVGATLIGILGQRTTQIRQVLGVFALVALEQAQQPPLEIIDRDRIGCARRHRLGRGEHRLQGQRGPVLAPEVGRARQALPQAGHQGFVLGKQGHGRDRLARQFAGNVIQQRK